MSSDEILMEAGIMRASALITTLPEDADNLFIVLTARYLNPTLNIISRASDEGSDTKLKIAGADNVIMPDKIGGAHMATLVISPDVVEMLSLMTLRNTAEFRVTEVPATRSVSLRELDLWKTCGCTLLGIKNHNSYTLNPPPDYHINQNERLIVMGSEEQIQKAREMV